HRSTNGSAFNGRPGAESRRNHKDRSARPVRCTGLRAKSRKTIVSRAQRARYIACDCALNERERLSHKMRATTRLRLFLVRSCKILCSVGLSRRRIVVATRREVFHPLVPSLVNTNSLLAGHDLQNVRRLVLAIHEL